MKISNAKCENAALKAVAQHLLYTEKVTKSLCSNRTLKETWTNALMHLNKQFDIKSNENVFVCEKHFRTEDIRYNNCRTTLTKQAVPVVFSNDRNDDFADFLLTTDENVVDFTNFSENLSQLSASSELSSRTVELSESKETKAVEKFFCCENCGHINSLNALSSSNIHDEEYIATERHMDKRKVPMCDMDVDFNPKIFKQIDPLSDEQPQAKTTSTLISFPQSSTPNQQQRSSPSAEATVDLSKSSKDNAPDKVEVKFKTIPKSSDLKEQIVSTPS